MKKSLLILIQFLIIFTTSLIFADSNNSIAVKDAIEIAEKNNPELNAMKNELEALGYRKTSVYSPEKTFINYAEEGVNGNFYAEKRFSIIQGFDFPLKTIYRASAINAERESLELKIDSRIREIKAEVKKTYSRLAYYQQVLKIRQIQTSLADSLNKAVYFRFEAGYATELDKMKSEIFLEEARNDLNDIKVKLHVSRYDLFTLIGLDPEKQSYDIEFPDSLVYRDVEIIQNEVLGLLEKYPGVSSSMKKQEIYNNYAKAATADLLPDLNLAYHKHDYGDGFDFFGFEVGLSLPVWFFLDQSAKAQEQTLLGENARWLHKQSLLAWKKEIEYSWHGYDESRKKIKRFNEKIRNKSLKLRELTFLAYREGQIGLLQMLDAEKIYLDNELRYLEELLNYYLNILDLEKFTNENYLF